MTQRILYMIDSLKVGGAETLLLDLLDAAADRGKEAHVAYFTPGPLMDEVASRGVPATRISSSGLKDPRAFLRTVHLIRAWKPDVLHTHLTKSDVVGQLAARAANVPRRILSLHNVDPWRRNRVLSAVYRAATSAAHVHVAVSDQVADFAAASGGSPRERLRVIRNGVDLRRFDPEATAPLDLAQWGVPADAVVAAVIGRLEPQKDHANFLEAAALLAARNPRVHFLVVGDGALRAALEAQAAAAGLTPDRLTFTGIVRDIPGLLAAIDLVVFSSAWEGLPMTLLEGMAMGRPVVSTSVGGIPGVISDGWEGRLVGPKDPAALADAMGLVVDKPEERAAMGRNARDTVRQRFSGEAMLNEVFATYEVAAAGE